MKIEFDATLPTPEKVSLPSAVEKLIADSAEFVARAAADEFQSEMKCNCVEVGLESPIEMLMWIEGDAENVVTPQEYFNV